jgi:hypothetical protein
LSSLSTRAADWGLAAVQVMEVCAKFELYALPECNAVLFNAISGQYIKDGREEWTGAIFEFVYYP